VVFAHHQRRIAVARLDRGLIGHDLHADAPPDRVVEACRHRAAADIELACAERGNHLRRGIECSDGHVQTILAEEAHSIGDVVSGIADGARDADLDLIGRDGGRIGRVQRDA
jgi:hypothetical protein